MQIQKLLFTALVMGALVTPAGAEWKKLDGQPVPDFTADTWLNTGTSTPSPASLRGKAYLIEFFATW